MPLPIVVERLNLKKCLSFIPYAECVDAIMDEGFVVVFLTRAHMCHTSILIRDSEPHLYVLVSCVK